MRTTRILPIVAILLSLLVAQHASAADAVIITNSTVAESSIDAGTIEKIYLGKKSTWSDGTKIVPVMLESGDARGAFLANLVKKSEGDFKAFWMQNVFAGKGTPPQTFNSEAELVNFVANNKGAIGFVSAGASIGSAKKMTVN